MNRGLLNGKTLRYERDLAHPIDRVWHVLTDEGETAYWFPGKIIGPREVGATVKFEFGRKPAGVMADDLAALIDSKQAAFENAPSEVFEGRIEVFDPPRVFALTWAGDQLRFELTVQGNGTKLVFDYTFVEAEAADVGAGWHISLDWLSRRLGDDSALITRADFEELEGLYKRAMP